jgi:3-hydroxyacyl-CoA dehydrogenase/enoyl-CoA hydratase/3-hydroxybutyryl-CoA epimerase/3-hydroxyacyl-CoA dehydrogenase/enoyl-CoA hydratase/3-hydroxybutyryl-CoA epimerase/enoyl-CoA isomerase
MGMASDFVAATSADELLQAAIRMIRAERKSGDYMRDRERWSSPIEISETELGFLGATASAYIQGQTKGHYPAPLAALELMLGAAGVDLETACQMEAEEFPKLFGTPINRALLNIFFLRERNKKDTGVSSDSSRKAGGTPTEPKKIVSAGVIGSGVMGQGIAAANAKRGIPVALLDADPAALARGVQGVLNEVAYNKATKKPEAQRAIELAPLVNGTLSDAEICNADLIIEAVFENREVKRQLFARIEPLMKADSLLCSNTSTIPITELAAGLKRPENFCGLHFFNPVRQMQLLEVIRGKMTSDATIATAVAYAKILGKMPIVMNDGPGFLVNRLLLPYMNEAALLLEEGASISSVERAAKDFGMPMGPITLYDVVGLDVAVHAGRTMVAVFPDRVVPSKIIERLFEARRFGQKTGRGFFDYEPTKGGKPPKGSESAEVAKIFEDSRWSSARHFKTDEITDRLFLPMLVEATRVLEDGLVRDVRDVDLALIYGIGFPPFRGGLFFWADQVGAEKIVDKLRHYEALGKRFEPTAMLTKLAATSGKFYG